jgi:hypothetical protein
MRALQAAIDHACGVNGGCMPLTSMRIQCHSRAAKGQTLLPVSHSRTHASRTCMDGACAPPMPPTAHMQARSFGGPTVGRSCCYYSTASPSGASSSCSTSSSRVLRASRLHGGIAGRSATRASSGSSDPIAAASAAANRFVKDATPKVESAVDEMKRSASRAYQRIDTEYEVSAKASKATKRLQEKVCCLW